MSTNKEHRDLSRPVKPDEASAVRGGDGNTKGKGGTVPPKPMEIKLNDTLVSGS